ncbi:hypothetical protein [Phaeobacter inhibens]|uniref:hypothetical protein n=1 Tax=Phaeobacter inhibens TaxID=221822 RepID=UPI00295F3E6F|nr:hypothetical protein [Phaeobacter inhibens]
MKLIFKHSLSAALLLAVSACANSDKTAGAVTAQPPLTQLGPDSHGRYKYRAGGNGYFRNETTGKFTALGILVDVSDVDRAPPETRKIYYTVEMDVWGERSFGRDERFPKRSLDAVPDKLLADSYNAISQSTQSARLIELAAMVSKLSICVDGTPRPDDRGRKRASLSPQQSARASGTFGGNPVGLLGKSPEELKRLGLGDLMSDARRIPTIDFNRHGKGYVSVHMMCVLK